MSLVALVPPRGRNHHMVSNAILHEDWIQDISEAIGPVAMVEYVNIWRRLRNVVLSPDPGIIPWRWTENDIYSAKFRYLTLFNNGSTQAPIDN